MGEKGGDEEAGRGGRVRAEWEGLQTSSYAVLVSNPGRAISCGETYLISSEHGVSVGTWWVSAGWRMGKEWRKWRRNGFAVEIWQKVNATIKPLLSMMAGALLVQLHSAEKGTLVCISTLASKPY